MGARRGRVPGDAPVIAGTGTNDTRHTVELTERAAEIGVDAVLVVTPVLRQAEPARDHRPLPGRRRAPPTCRSCVYNIPSRTAIDMPNDLLAELAQIDNVVAVKQARYEDLAPIDGLDLLAGNDDMLAKVLDMGGAGGILVASHLVGREMRRMIDEPDARHEIHDVARATSTRRSPSPPTRSRSRPRSTSPATTSAACGCRWSRPTRRRRRSIRAGARAPRAAGRRFEPSTLRVLPLGGLGEIGKNMMVVEYDGRIVVVDTGLMFPAPDQLGIDLVLPDFTYLRERADDIEAIVLTHGHEDHVGALPVRAARARPRPRRSTAARSRPRWCAPSSTSTGSRTSQVEDVLAAPDASRPGPFSVEMVKMAHSIPDAFAVALSCELGTTLVTGDYKFDQTPVDGVPADVSRLAELGPRGPAAALRRLHQRRPRRACRRRSRAWARSSRRSSRAAAGASSSPASRRTSTACSRWSTPPRRSAARSSLVGRSMRKNVNIGRMLGHIDDPGGHAGRAQARSRTSRTTSWWSSPPAARASRCRRSAGWPTATIRMWSCTTATP